MEFIKKNLFWINRPKKFEISTNKIEITTEPCTDFWQKTYYGFCNDNSPALLLKSTEKNFSFSVKTDFNTNSRFDQCGVIIYQNSNNWFKASIEFEDKVCQRLGSVVTNYGYSDWATTDIDVNIKSMYYRLSRINNDFCIESSFDGTNYNQMRIFHLFEATNEINFGVYACSPENSSFDAIFSEIKITDCMWLEHKFTV